MHIAAIGNTKDDHNKEVYDEDNQNKLTTILTVTITLHSENMACTQTICA